MRYTLQQKFFSFGDDYRVVDENGRDRYIIDGSAFSIRNSTAIRDTSGEKVAHLHRKLLSLGPTYEIERNGRTTVVHKHLFTLFRCKFTVDVPGPDDLEARGNFWDMEYEFVNRADHRIAQVSKRWFTMRDTYGIEIDPGHDDVLLIAAAVVIDLCCHDGKKRD